MPSYDFYCPTCGVIEITKSMLDPNPRICPRCKSSGLIRRFVPINKIMYGDHYVTGRKQEYPKGDFSEVVPRSS